MQKKFFITTAIDYPSAKPHIGHLYEKVCADAIARWHRLLNEKVFFSTGTDEHGLKLMRKAREAGLKPKEFVDSMVPFFKKLCKVYNISFDRFIRTTDKDHELVAQKVFQLLYEKGDIYLGKYEGLYCADCETFYLEKDLNKGKCPVHNKDVELVSEESYFFKMSKYEKQILDYFKQPLSVLPKEKKREVLNRLKNGLHDLSVSRTSIDWAIPVPFDKKHYQYVWMDALLNYISVIGFGTEKFKEFWPADIHLIGNDIVWHHTVIWWSILLALDLELPKTIFVHGFINTETGEKMSKSKGNVIDPLLLAEKFNTDSIRYFLLREIPFGEDGFFSEKKLIERNNNELANDLGNLVFRVLSLIEKKLDSRIPEAETLQELKEKLNLEKIMKHMEKLELHLALAEIMSFVKECNKFVNERQPWKQEGKELNETLYSLADSLRIIAILLQPFMPVTARKIFSQLSLEPQNIDKAEFNLLKPGTRIEKKEVLFKKIEA